MSKLTDLVRTTLVVLAACAVGQELAKPAEERTWHGKVGGFVPYDFRRPTVERLRAAYWNADNPSLFSERVFGVGWAVNLYQAWRRLQEVVRSRQSPLDKPTDTA